MDEKDENKTQYAIYNMINFIQYLNTNIYFYFILLI